MKVGKDIIENNIIKNVIEKVKK